MRLLVFSQRRGLQRKEEIANERHLLAREPMCLGVDTQRTVSSTNICAALGAYTLSRCQPPQMLMGLTNYWVWGALRGGAQNIALEALAMALLTLFAQ